MTPAQPGNYAKERVMEVVYANVLQMAKHSSAFTNCATRAM